MKYLKRIKLNEEVGPHVHGSYRIGTFDEDDMGFANDDEQLLNFIDQGRVYLETDETGGDVWIDEDDDEVVTYFNSVWGWEVEPDYDDDEYPDDVECPDCEGTGYDEDGGECERCGGEGREARPWDIPPD